MRRLVEAVLFEVFRRRPPRSTNSSARSLARTRRAVRADGFVVRVGLHRFGQLPTGRRSWQRSACPSGVSTSMLVGVHEVGQRVRSRKATVLGQQLGGEVAVDHADGVRPLGRDEAVGRLVVHLACRSSASWRVFLPLGIDPVEQSPTAAGLSRPKGARSLASTAATRSTRRAVRRVGQLFQRRLVGLLLGTGASIFQPLASLA